jgi:L-amino acid N-acyltransferase YncA
MNNVIRIQPCRPQHWASVWRILRPAFRAGETYAFSPDIGEVEARHAWIQVPAATFVALNSEDEVLGTYYLKPNQPALGAHVCNCGYVVAGQARGQGIGSAMCEHSQLEARARGFRAMQYNLVVCTNEDAIRLWKKHGFAVIGVLPGAFRHARLGYVDALVMYKSLVG